MGDNDIAVIIGIEGYQGLPKSDYSYDDARLVADYAKALGFKVVLKPQILVPNNWAGNIKMADDLSWRQWFDNYTKAIEHYADIARKERVDILVIGTELNHTAHLTFWQPLIADIRNRFKGKLTYAAHNIEGIKQFSHWELLDSIALTLYPSLGDKPERDAMTLHIRKVVDDLKAIGMQYKKPLWIAEVGIPSFYGAQLKPWEWQGAGIYASLPDENIQAMVLDFWLDALNGEWNQGVMLWCWNSDPAAGGPQDTGFTLQNKRAEKVAACHWAGRCSDINAKEHK
ncbi:MAG: hypothetical protein HY279_06910 [Nitrospinae bacterium]|nr:hypothetical protein [Nitrospinota bacterium]